MPPRPARTSPLILVVDDDPVVRMQACGCLQEAGYQVVAAASMPDAMVAMAGVGPIQVLVTDLRMPMDGLVGEVKRLYPAVRVLFMASDNTDGGVVPLPGPSLPKPIDAKKLLREVKRLLGKK
jgi:two-component system, response regulator PdtaR